MLAYFYQCELVFVCVRVCVCVCVSVRVRVRVLVRTCLSAAEHTED